MSQVFDPALDPTRSTRPYEATPLTCRVDGATLFLIGEADAGTVDEITACLEQAPSTGDIDVDLADITFLDLTALRVIMRFGSELAACGRSLTVVNPSRPVALLLRVTGFDRTSSRADEASPFG
jgi:anti-anti-sigma factor